MEIIHSIYIQFVYEEPLRERVAWGVSSFPSLNHFHEVYKTSISLNSLWRCQEVLLSERSAASSNEIHAVLPLLVTCCNVPQGPVLFRLYVWYLCHCTVCWRYSTSHLRILPWSNTQGTRANLCCIMLTHRSYNNKTQFISNAEYIYKYTPSGEFIKSRVSKFVLAFSETSVFVFINTILLHFFHK